MFMRGGEGSFARFGPGFFSKPNTMADFSFFFNIRLNSVQEFVFPNLRDSFLPPPPTPNKKKNEVGLLTAHVRYIKNPS